MLKARMTAEQIQLREGLEPTLVANEIARAVALGEGLPETFFDYGCVPQESRAEVYELTKSVKDARGRHSRSSSRSAGLCGGPRSCSATAISCLG
jgi:hypothetical protein